MSIQYVDKNCDAVSSNAQNYAITAGVNDKLQIVIDGGVAQNFTLTAGASRTAAQIAADLNATLSGATAYAVAAGAQGGHVRIRTTSQNGASSTITFNSPANNANSTLGFSGTYTGSSRINNAWTQVLGTKQELINQIETQLNSCGWTTISGSGTTNLLLQSSLTPPGQDLQYRLRVKDNAGSCVTLTIENVAGTVAQTSSTTSGIYLLPAVAKTWNFICNKYGGCITTNNNIAREFAIFGSLALPTFLQSVITELAWIQGNCISDGSGTGTFCFYNNLWSGAGNFNSNQAMFVNSVLLNNFGTSGSNQQANQAIIFPSGNGNNLWAGYQWHDGSVTLADALLAFGLASTSDPGKIRGYIWDAAAVSAQSFTVASLPIFDSHNWVVITAQLGNAIAGGLGQLLLTIP